MDVEKNWKKYFETPPQEPHYTVLLTNAACAREFLSRNTNNRRLEEVRVREHSMEMLAGRFTNNNDAIVMGADNVAYNGQHRMGGLIRADEQKPGIAFPVLWMFGAPVSARPYIDAGGRIRRVSETLQILDGTKNSQKSVGYLGMCVRLAARNYVPIPTTDAYYRWMHFFKSGIDWALERFVGARGFEAGQIAGSLAFAYKSNPEIIREFGTKLVEGQGLKNGDPAWVLRRHILQGKQSVGHGHSPRGKDSLTLAKRVLNAALAEIQGQKLNKTYESDHGLDYFRTTWDTPKLREAVAPYTPKVHSIIEAKPPKGVVKVPGAILAASH